MTKLPKSIKGGVLLEAEVVPNGKTAFEQRYSEATGVSISPGRPTEYQEQQNKWGTELRIYFNDQDLADWMEEKGARVEVREAGYKSGDFRFRVNNNEIWWGLVENDGLHLGNN